MSKIRKKKWFKRLCTDSEKIIPLQPETEKQEPNYCIQQSKHNKWKKEIPLSPDCSVNYLCKSFEL
ncbi:hypothetical protein FSS13T_21980 [Flavobacterium saliperosum S13]|uniref:Uncharacterized protein n=1 Tax=Flavobacterium saliperosum S13 TaxID=1341155 RepID=A0ABN0QEK4_9FLAO|nr:hypothetical protein FSS13T_21980 [Flavobacterium saliperosum S13]